MKDRYLILTTSLFDVNLRTFIHAFFMKKCHVSVMWCPVKASAQFLVTDNVLSLILLQTKMSQVARTFVFWFSY